MVRESVLQARRCPRRSRVHAWTTLLALSLAAFACEEQEERTRGLLLVTIDTLRADRVGAYGADAGATPALDALAAGGVLFEHAMSPVPLTLPAHATLLTGQLPPHHGVRLNGVHTLPEEAGTLAEQLREAGHATAAVVGAVVLAPEYGLAQGFEHYDAPRAGRSAGVGGYLERSAGEVTERALAWLGEQRGPFFLWVHYYDPHREFQPPSPWRERFAQRPYEGEIAYVDAQLGRLLAAVAAREDAEHTVVAVTADHGESLGEHGERSHGLTLHDAVLHVPLLLAGPGLPRGARVDEVVSLADVAPTLEGLMGLPVPAPEERALRGRDLAELWREVAAAGAAKEPPAAYAETLLPQHSHGWAPLFSVRSAGERYVRAPRAELYDLVEDPGETANRLDARVRAATPEDLEAASRLDRRIEAVLAGEVATEERTLDAATRAELAALGYAMPATPPPASGRDPKDGLPMLQRYEEAMRLFDRGALDEAEALLLAALEEVPESPALHGLLARVLARQGRLDRAAAEAATALEGSPDQPAHRSLLGMIELQRGRPEAAESAFRAAMAGDPNRAEAHVGMLWVSLRGGRDGDALAHAERAAGLAGSDWRVHQWLASLWSQAGRFGRALAAVERAGVAGASPPALEVERAVALTALGRASEAESALQRAGDAAHTPVVRNRLAVATAQGGDPARAHALLEALVADHPGHAPARRNLASLEQAMAARTP